MTGPIPQELLDSIAKGYAPPDTPPVQDNNGIIPDALIKAVAKRPVAETAAALIDSFKVYTPPADATKPTTTPSTAPTRPLGGTSEAVGPEVPLVYVPPAEHTVGAAFRTAEERAVEEARLPGESRRAFLERTAAKRKELTDLQQLNTRDVVKNEPTGIEGWAQKAGNLRLFDTPGLLGYEGIDVGAPARFLVQINAPGVHELAQGNVARAGQHYAEVAKTLFEGITSPLINEPLALAYDMASGNDYLLPEERRDYIRNAAANYAALAIGAGVGRVLRTGEAAILTAGRKSLEEMSSAELMALSKAQAPNRYLVGAAEGLTGGAVAGGILEKDPERRAQAAASMALLSLPLGLAFELTRSKVVPSSLDEAAKGAADLWSLRQLRIGEESSFEQATNNLYHLNTQGDIARALIRTSPDRPVVVTALDDNALETTLNDVVIVQKSVKALAGGRTENTAVYKRPDGKNDLLIMPEFGERVRGGVISNRDAKNTFEVSGHLPDSPVSFLGQDYAYIRPSINTKGKLDGHVIRDAAGTEYTVDRDMLQRGPDMMISPIEADKARAQTELYKEFKKVTSGFFDPTGKIKEDAVPNKAFDDIVDAFVQQKRLPPGDVQPLRNFLEARLAADLTKQSLEPAEYAQYQRLLHEAATIRNSATGDVLDLVASSGYLLERNGGSALLLRDPETNSIIGRFNSLEGVRKFINESGVSNEGVKLDGGGRNGVPPTGFGKGAANIPIPPNGPQSAPFNFLQDGVLRQWSHWVNTTFPGTRMTGMRQIMIALDQQFGTDFTNIVWDKNNANFMAKHAVAHADMVRAAGIARFARGLTPDELDHVTTLMETIAPKDMVLPGGLFKRAFTQREIQGANWFINNHIDTEQAYKYYRALKKLNAKYGSDDPKFDIVATAYRKRWHVDDAHAQAAKIIATVLKKNDPDNLSIMGIVRLANAVMHNDLSPAEYIKQNGLSPKVVELAKLLKDQYKDLAPKFNIPEERELAAYFPHLRVYKDGAGIFNKDMGAFVNELLRTGELSEYDRDPINALVRYINAGYNHKFTRDAWNAAAKYIDKTTAKLGDQGPFVKDLLQRYYLDELRGIPHDSSKFMQASLESTLDRLGIETDINARKDLVNTFLSLSSTYFIGFRPAQGIRDLQNIIAMHYSRFGGATGKRTARMLSMISRYSPQDLVDMGIISESKPREGVTAAMSREGIIPDVGAVSVVTPQEQLAGSLRGRVTGMREIIQKAGDLGIKWGLQHNVYQWAHAAVYLESYTNTLDVINKMVHNEFGAGAKGKAKAYKKLLVNTFDIPVAKRFDELVTVGKYDEAAKYLARASSFEVNSIFGLANHPAGWGTATGRLIGQFGSWPTWARVQMVRMATRGTLSERSAAMARFGMTQGALKGASWALGLNLSSWYLPFAAPALNTMETVSQALDEYDTDKQLKLAAKAAFQGIGGMAGATLFRGGPIVSALGSLEQLGDPYSTNDEDAINNLTRSWSLGLPTPLVVSDIDEAVGLLSQGYNPISAIARAFGVRSTENPSMLNPYGVQKQR